MKGFEATAMRGVVASALFGMVFLSLVPAGAQTKVPAMVSAGTNQIPSLITNPPPSKLIDPVDGWLDASGFLDTAYGFVPLFMPITEPAVGYGVGGGLIFIDRKEPKPGQAPQKPNMAVVGGMLTENNSWAVLGGHSGNWQEGQVETLVGLMGGSINLDFYGVGDGSLTSVPMSYNIQPLGGIVEGRYRIGKSPVRVGLGYLFGQANVSFNSTVLPPGVLPAELDSFLAGLTPKVIYDSRDNLFTPNQGIYAELNCGVFNEAVGSDFNYETVGATFIYYHPLAKTLTLGVRTEGNFSFDDAPFYTRPFINLRGVAVRRYVGEHAADAELELRWQCWQRFSLVGFGGAGIAWNDFERFQSERTVVTGGVGFRYELARKYGLHMGLDVAFGPDEPAIYIQFGNAWFRP